MIRRLLHITILLGSVLGAVYFAGCQKGLYGDVEGVVVEIEKGEPVQDVEVRLDKTGFTGKTDAAGVFRFKHVPIGVYALVCTKPNSYFRQTTIPNFRIRTDSMTRANVALEVKASLIYEDTLEPLTLTSLKPECRIFKGRYGLMNDPRKSATNLVLVRRDDKRILSKTGGLDGSVTIGSEDQALELVRLYTDLKTFFYFREHSPDNSFIEVRPTEGKPGLGEIAKERGKKLGIILPVVTADENGYTVTRYVMSMAQNLYRLKERVGFDGNYVVTEKTLIIPKMDILLPAS